MRATAAAVVIEELFPLKPLRVGWRDAATVRQSPDPTATASELARKYVHRDRGGQHRAMVCELLLRAAGLPELGRLQRREDIEVTSERDVARQRGQLLENAGTVAYFPDAPAEKSDPQLGRRSPPLQTIGTGARRLALRGEGRCIVRGDAPPEGRVDYCGDHRQHLTDKERWQHKREIKVALDWAAPVIASGPSRVDARRSRRRVSGHAGDTL